MKVLSFSDFIWLLKQPAVYAVLIFIITVVAYDLKRIEKRSAVYNEFANKWDYFKRRWFIILFSFVGLEIMFGMTLLGGKQNRDTYDAALAYEMSGDYVNAYETYQSIAQYEQLGAERRMDEIYEKYKYQLAGQKVREGDLLSAISIYIEIRDYKDSDDLLYELVQQWVIEGRREKEDNNQ